jgi:hypothetical protein
VICLTGTLDPRGAAVETPQRFGLFAGGNAPHRDGDFVHYRSYRGLSGEVVTMLSVIDRPFRAPELKQRPQPAEAGGSKSHRLPAARRL